VNKRKTIAIDIDDTIAGSTEALRLRVNEKKRVNIPQTGYQIPGEYWGYYERVWTLHGVEANIDEFHAEMVEDQSHIPLLPGALFAVKNLAEKYDIIFITARHNAWEAATRKWFEQNLPSINHLQLYFTNDHTDTLGKTKGQLCVQLGVSLLIDDNVEHCRSALEENVKAILYGEYGWHLKMPPQLVRCKDWPSVLEYVNEKA
jgi:5'(3')-deoxyribonucleotidase